MPAIPINVLLDQPVSTGGQISLAYPQGKNEGHFFGAVNHTLAIEGTFFRSPRDFTIITQPDRLVLVWQANRALPKGSLLNLQMEMPGGDFYFDNKIGVTVQDMVEARLFMVNLGSPIAPDPNYWVTQCPVSGNGLLKLNNTHTSPARNVIIYSSHDNTGATFTIAGIDPYNRPMVEVIMLGVSEMTQGNKSFTQIKSITPSKPCEGEIAIGTGNKFGLPVFLPAPGYLMREIIAGQSTTGGTIVSAETGIPSSTGGDRRGTYTPPNGIELDGKKSIHLLLSLPAPGNIGIPDFALGTTAAAYL